jgi:hypothetical protein
MKTRVETARGLLALRRFTFAAMTASALLPLGATANVLVNGDFESQPAFGSGVSGNAGYSALTGLQIPGWTIEPGHAATVHNTVLYPTISGSFSINMDGEGYLGGNADLHQDLASAPGAAYSLQYDWSTWEPSSAPLLNVTVTDSVTAAVLYTASFAAATSGVVNHVTAGFVGTGNALRLRVRELPQSGFNDNTFMVDNFNVSAVPEAATLLQMASGLLALCALARRRFPV